MVTNPLPELCREEGGVCAGTSSSMPGMVSGTAAPGSTMARPRFGKQQPNAGSIRSRRAGRCSRCRRRLRPTAHARAGRCRRWTSGWCAANTRLFSSSIPRSTGRPSIPATSGATCRACGRTAGSTPMRRSGRRWRFAALGDAGRAWELLRMINPVNHALSAQGRHLQARTLRRRGRRLCPRAAHRSRRLELVHRLCRLDVPADRRVAAGPATRGGELRFAPCLPADWPASGSTTAMGKPCITSPSAAKGRR
jgi:hypothetical protein